MDILEQARLDDSLRLAEDFSSLGFSSSMKLVAQRFQGALNNLDLTLPLPSDETACKSKIAEYIKLMSAVVLKIFASTGCNGFFPLHLVTGMRALKKVLLGKLTFSFVVFSSVVSTNMMAISAENFQLMDS